MSPDITTQNLIDLMALEDRVSERINPKINEEFTRFITINPGVCPIVVHGGKQFPAYEEIEDLIWIPHQRMFNKYWFGQPDIYFYMLSHEVTHCTGSIKRLHRFELKKILNLPEPEKDFLLGTEEMIADLGALILCYEFRMLTRGVLKECLHHFKIYWGKTGFDRSTIQKARKNAEKAIDFLFDSIDGLNWK
jgi:antirestriction protein ArdC